MTDSIKLLNRVENIPEWIASLRLKTRSYLTEPKLKIFVAENLKYDSILDTNQVKVIISGKTYKPDIGIVRNEKLELVLIEFDGYQHYTKSSVIHRDRLMKMFCKLNNIRLIQIPYFVQLDKDTTDFYFNGLLKKDIDKINFDEYKYPHGFIDSKAILPADFCVQGVNRFLEELKELPEVVSKSIISSLKEKAKTLGDFLVYPSLEYKQKILEITGGHSNDKTKQN